MLAKALSAATAAAAAQKLYVEDVFSTWLYTGNGSTQTITNGIDLAGEGGLVWVKARSETSRHFLCDTERGATNHISTDRTSGQSPVADSITAFGGSGFSLGSDTTLYAVNSNLQSYASWTFRKAEKFFDIVTYTGTGANRTVAHNLGSVPGCIIVKRLDTTTGWIIYHRSLGATKNLEFDTNAQNTTAVVWNNTEPTSSVFTLGTSSQVNASGGTYVAYLFAHDAGGFGDSGNDSVVSCGSYTGNGSAVGPFVDLGWEPQWLIIKNASSTGDWAMFDNMRGFLRDGNSAWFRANTNAAEASQDFVSISSTGFNPTFSYTNVNTSGQTYIYIAIRRGPMKTPTDATKVFFAGTAANYNTYTVGFPTDAFILGYRAGWADNAAFMSRLTGVGYLASSKTQQEFTFNGTLFDLQNDFKQNATSNSTSRYNLRRAPGFFDVVAYTGTGSARTVSHNLGVVPELMIIKRRNGAVDWAVYEKTNSATNWLVLNQNYASSAASSAWNNTEPTASVFTVATASEVNNSAGTYIAYLFASCLGVSKVGSYTGTGTTKDIDCGFTNGARFVLIKRTDSTGDWYVWDTARGIVSGNDPYLLLNSTAAEVTNTDYIDPLSSGFQISSTAPAAINASGGSFIFLAIA